MNTIKEFAQLTINAILIASMLVCLIMVGSMVITEADATERLPFIAQLNQINRTILILKPGCIANNTTMQLYQTNRFNWIVKTGSLIFVEWKVNGVDSAKLVENKTWTPEFLISEGKRLTSDISCVTYGGITSKLVNRGMPTTGNLTVDLGLPNIPNLGWHYMIDGDYHATNNDTPGIAGTEGVNLLPLTSDYSDMGHGDRVALAYLNNSDGSVYVISHTQNGLQWSGDLAIYMGLSAVMYQKGNHDPNNEGVSTVGMSFNPENGIGKYVDDIIGQALDQGIVSVIAWDNDPDGFTPGNFPTQGLSTNGVTVGYVTSDADGYILHGRLGNQIGTDENGNPIYDRPMFVMEMNEFSVNDLGQTIPVEGSSYAVPLWSAIFDKLAASNPDKSAREIIKAMCETAKPITENMLSKIPRIVGGQVIRPDIRKGPKCGIPEFYTANELLKNPGYPWLKKGVLKTDCFQPECKEAWHQTGGVSTWNRAISISVKLMTRLLKEPAFCQSPVLQPAGNYAFNYVIKCGSKSNPISKGSWWVRWMVSDKSCPEPNYYFEPKIGFCSTGSAH